MFMIWLMPLAVLLLIFSFSSQDAPTSTKMSKKVTETLHSSTSIPTLTNSQVRDLAHMGFFFLFGLSCMIAFSLCNYSLRLSSIFTLLLGGISAFLDECIQLTSPGRAFEWVDMGKDMIGVTLSILVASSILFILKHTFRYIFK